MAGWFAGGRLKSREDIVQIFDLSDRDEKA